MSQHLILILAVTSIISSLKGAAGNTCFSDGTKDISFVVSSKRNATSHRHITADIILGETECGSLNVPADVNLEVSQSLSLTSSSRQMRITALLTVPEKRLPPPGYELEPGLGWYRLHMETLTWEEARLACEAEGAHLAVINSRKEAAVLQRMFARVPSSIPNATWNNQASVGFSVTEGRYLTIFGQTLQEAGYAKWYPGQPDNNKTDTDPDQNCGAVNRAGTFNDIPCNGKFIYFCEFEL